MKFRIKQTIQKAVESLKNKEKEITNVAKSVAPQTERKKRGAPFGNKNAVGHGAPFGNKNAAGFGAPFGNKNAEKHGLFGRILFTGVCIPYTPENLIVLERMKADGVDFGLINFHAVFNAYKKFMKDEIRQKLKEQKIEKLTSKKGK